MNVLDFGKLALITVTPTLVGAAAVYGPRICGVIARAWAERTQPDGLPYGPPIERLAADLRRLLALHDELARSAHLAMRAHRLWAVEAAIGARAIEAARALDVPHRDPDLPGDLTRAELVTLLHALAGAGLVLPATVGRFTRGGRL
ncbi:hypothetical protein [Actinoplanes sp. N902-109]|uniref:hypothetical protein n=1 Tax=Actinoplanes sp. (strain N902-109) TaxID=649831 RepID=UPI0003295906|nr:hypothetical protein [Actinoplanes sp. N902-109]AGL18454.1 hypothetical protein L083_4944 [Actinoplanes sp. N902-109]